MRHLESKDVSDTNRPIGRRASRAGAILVQCALAEDYCPENRSKVPHYVPSLSETE